MRVIQNGKTALHIRASSLARLYFFQEFDIELDRFIIDELQASNEPAKLSEALFKIVWAMWKADAFYTKTHVLDYRSWLTWMMELRFDMSRHVDAVMEEIESGFTVKRTYNTDKTGTDAGNLANKIIAVALKMGMSLDELNELTTQALIDIMHEYVKTAGGEDTKRRATPKETAMFFGVRR